MHTGSPDDPGGLYLLHNLVGSNGRDIAGTGTLRSCPDAHCMAFIYVGVVLVLAYIIDAFKVQRDIDYINEHITKVNKDPR